MGKKSKKAVSYPNPKKVWRVLSELTRAAYFYELEYEGRLAQSNPIDRSRLKSQMKRIVDLYVEIPRKHKIDPYIGYCCAAMVEDLADAYAEIAKRNLLGQEAIDVITRDLRFPKLGAEKLLLSPEQIKQRRGGSTGGPYESALDVIGRLFLDMSRTKFREFIKKSEETVNKFGGTGVSDKGDFNLHTLQRQQLLETVVSRLEFSAPPELLWPMVSGGFVNGNKHPDNIED